MVTAADKAVERLIIERLRSVRPADAVLSEETGDHRGAVGASVRWLLDPIDGTVNYVYGIPYYSVSLAAEVDGEVVAGVVHNIATGTVYTATKGGGAYAGDRRLTGSHETDFGLALVGTGFGYDAGRRAHQARVLAGLAAQIRDIRRFGSAALDLCHVAEGVLDGFYESGLNPWDLAAGSLVAREAGIVVTGLVHETPDDGFVVAGTPAIHARLRSVLVDLDAGGGP
jgi:myo-inositol-1(or 4)-monophosphatase